MKRLCLFGGSFDPVHLGHAAMVEAALGPGEQEQVRVLPAGSPPHKPAGLGASPEDRLAMVRLAFAGQPRVRVSDFEIRRGGTSYTIDTVRACLEEQTGADSLALLIGADSLPDLPTWKEWREILRLCRFLVVPRPGFPSGISHEFLGLLSPRERDLLEVSFLDVPPVAISSSEVRRRVARGAEWASLVAPEVARRIQALGLYRDPK